MIKIVYGYCVKNGGIGRYIAETVRHFSDTSNYQIVTMKCDVDFPADLDVKIIKSDHEQAFMSEQANAAFSKEIEKQKSQTKDFIHSHGVYSFTPDLYTAHICIAAYIESIGALFGKDAVRKDIRDPEYMLRSEKHMMKTLTPERIVAVSAKVARELSEIYSIDVNGINIIPGASRFTQNKVQKTIKEGRCLLGFVGGNMYTKGIALLVDVVRELSARGVSVSCIGAGCSRDVEILMASQCNFISMGKCDLTESFYRDVDILVSLAPHDSWPLCNIEAMSQSIPVVSTIGNGIFEYEGAGLALAEANPQSIANVIERVMMDQDFKNSIVIRGLAIAQSLDWVKNANSYEKLYTELLA